MQSSLDEETNEEEDQEKLPEDGSRPFSPPAGARDTLPEDHPELDDINSQQQWYDEGRDGEIGGSDPGDRGIEGYTPPTGDKKPPQPPPEADSTGPNIPGDQNQLR